jgi:hypothetical protein
LKQPLRMEFVGILVFNCFNLERVLTVETSWCPITWVHQTDPVPAVLNSE